MSDDAGPALSVAEFVEYCRTQAGLLSGRVETMSADANDLLDEIDAEMATLRSRLEERTTAAAASPSGPDGPGEDDLEAIEELERELEEKQALVDAKQARMSAFQELAAGYADLAEELQSAVDDGRNAMTRVVEFEAENDAPAYFEDRQTVLEAALSNDDE